ncbi:50S ribosomal protein L3-2 [Hibiscus syriacus]|uniref:50S ribosomal protein L3-2 n=1 Tax=Hibiscus syriacus TaxID=106335 RepID=A0A6A2Z3X9_HIBSY|nr:50S ribosomal protein L3-2 [Hibiscus syriacus]
MRVLKLGNYELGKTLGEGSFGKVKSGSNLHSGQPFALKILDKSTIIQLNITNQVSKGVTKMPKELSPGAWGLITRILDPNPETRITMADIKADEWFKQDYTPAVHYDEEDDIYIDEEAFSMSEMDASERKVRFTSNHSAKNLLARIKDTVTEKGFRVQTKNGRLKATQEQNGQTCLGSRLSITAEVFEISSSLHVVELRKSYGDSTFYRQLCRKLSNELGIPQSQVLISCDGGFPRPEQPLLRAAALKDMSCSSAITVSGIGVIGRSIGHPSPSHAPSRAAGCVWAFSRLEKFLEPGRPACPTRIPNPSTWSSHRVNSVRVNLLTLTTDFYR